MSASWSLTFPEKPWTVNAQHNMHWAKLAPLRKRWREAFKVLALAAKIPPLDRISVSVHLTTATRRMADTGACYGAVKAAIDGLVDAGVVPDDRGQEVAWITLWPPEHTGADSLRLVVAAVPLPAAEVTS